MRECKECGMIMNDHDIECNDCLCQGCYDEIEKEVSESDYQAEQADRQREHDSVEVE